MKPLLLIIVITLLLGCGNPVNHLYIPNQTNACIPQAIICKKALEKKKVWARVLLYYYTGKSMGHAVCVYEYGNRLWTYDHLGSFTVRAEKNNPLEIARQAEMKRGRKAKVVRAKFID